MSFIPREPGESLAVHLFRNAAALGADRQQTARLREAASMSMPNRSGKDRAWAGRVAHEVRQELKAAMDALVFAAQARGETVVEFNDDGARRIKGRDGLLSLHLSGRLTTGQVEAGLALRALAEKAGLNSVGSQLGHAGEVAARRSGCDGVVWQGLDRAWASVRVTEAFKLLSAADHGEGLVRLVRAIAIEGHSVRAAAAGGQARASAAARLARGLVLVSVSLEQTRDARQRAASEGGLRITGH